MTISLSIAMNVFLTLDLGFSDPSRGMVTNISSKTVDVTGKIYAVPDFQPVTLNS